ncbi:MAG: CvpA family protein [Clostridia bacterium]|nr:CvpA family protein [Clostridia bacterium]
MNIIDILLLLIIGISVIFAVYRGFLASLLGTAACLLSLVFALAAGPKLADVLAQNQGITELLATYTDADSLVGDATLARTPVMILNTDTLENILKTVSLPPVVQDALRSNVRSAAFSSRGLSSVSEYISATIISVLLSAGCFLMCFFACFLALHILINLVDHVFYFPVLRHLNGPASALMGLARGVLIVCAVLIVVPLIRTAIPFDIVQRYIEESRIFPILYSEKLLLRVIGA